MFVSLSYASDRVTRRFENALKATQERERQDYPTVLGLLERASQYVSDGPDQICETISRNHG